MDYYPIAEVNDPGINGGPPTAWIAGAPKGSVSNLTRFLGEGVSQASQPVRVGAFGPTAAPEILGSKATSVVTEFIGKVASAVLDEHGAMGRREAIENTASRRVKLLAVQYASSKPSKELAARLEILDARMNSYSPRVSQKSIAALENSVAFLARSSSALEEIDRLLGE